MSWKCDECKKETDRLQICWGTCGSEKVDVLDYFCPHCPSTELTFQGAEEECQAYWRMEWDEK